MPAALLARERWPARPRCPRQTLLIDAHEASRERAAPILDRVVAIEPTVSHGAAALGRRLRRRMADDFAWWMKAGQVGLDAVERERPAGPAS